MDGNAAAVEHKMADEEQELPPPLVDENALFEQEMADLAADFNNNFIEFNEDPVEMNWGTTNKNWVGFLSGMNCKDVYGKTVNEFLRYHELKLTSYPDDLTSMEDKMIDSMTTLWIEQHDAGYAPTTLRSKYSALKKFWLHTGRGDLGKQATLLEANLSKWDKNHTIKQSKIFTKPDFEQIYNLPRTATSIGWKAFAAVGTAFAGRGSEIHTLQFDDIEQVTNTEGVRSYVITFDRLKNAGPRSSDRDKAILNCTLGVKALDDYIALFPAKKPPAGANQRLFRKINESRRGPSVSWNSQNVGLHTMKAYGVNIATAIGLPTPEKYTGHCWRRSAATLAAGKSPNWPHI